MAYNAPAALSIFVRNLCVFNFRTYLINLNESGQGARRNINRVD